MTLAARLFRFKGATDRLAELGLIVLHGQHVVCLLFANLCGDLGLATHRVDGHDGLRQVEQLQQPRDRGDLVRLLLARLLAEHEAILRGPSEHQIPLAATAERAVVAAAQRLAINGHDLARRARTQGLDPRRQTAQELVGVQPLKHACKRIGRGNTAAQVLTEPVQLLPAVIRQILPRVTAAERDDDNIEQIVPPRPIHTRVCQTFQAF